MQKYIPLIFPFFSFASVAFSTFFLFNKSTLAQVGISPMVIESQTSRGQSEAVINLLNPTNTPVRVRIFSQPFTYSREGQFQTIASSQQDLSPYLLFSPREVALEPGASRKVRLLTQLDPNLPDGEYRAVVFAESLIENINNQGSRVGVIARVATTVYVTKGNQAPNLIVANGSFDPKQNQLRLLLRNQGTATARPIVSWHLKQGATVVRKGETQPSTVLASNERSLTIDSLTTGSSLSPGTYELSGELIWIQNQQRKSVSFKVPINIGQSAGVTR